jgi:hypothetical protein
MSFCAMTQLEGTLVGDALEAACNAAPLPAAALQSFQRSLLQTASFRSSSATGN